MKVGSWNTPLPSVLAAIEHEARGLLFAEASDRSDVADYAPERYDWPSERPWRVWESFDEACWQNTLEAPEPLVVGVV